MGHIGLNREVVVHCREKDCLESEICVYIDRTDVNILESLGRLGVFCFLCLK